MHERTYVSVVMDATLGTFSENFWVHFYGYISDKRSARNVPIKMYPEVFTKCAQRCAPWVSVYELAKLHVVKYP